MSMLAIRPTARKGWMVVPIASIGHIEGQAQASGRVIGREGEMLGYVDREDLDDLLWPTIPAAPGWYVARDGGDELAIDPVIAWRIEDGAPVPITSEGRPTGAENWALVLPDEMRTATGRYAEVPYERWFGNASELAGWFRERREEAKAARVQEVAT